MSNLGTTYRGPPRMCPTRPRGITLIEVIVVVAIIILAFLFLLMMLPHGREQARLLSCQKNLGQIGVALAMYDQFHDQLPTIATLSAVETPITRSPGRYECFWKRCKFPTCPS